MKVSGVFRHSWNMGNYPFDRHVLTIAIENTNAPASEFAYRADRAASQPSRDIALDGWRISGFEIKEQTYVYDTTFGDPAFAGRKQSDYSRLLVSARIERTKRLSFLTLVAGVYAAFALSAIAFLLGPHNGRRRANLLAGTFFAVVVNHRVAESVIGRTETITLLDEIHLSRWSPSSRLLLPESRRSGSSIVAQPSRPRAGTSADSGPPASPTSP